jgi:hypothetical protein
LDVTASISITRRSPSPGPTIGAETTAATTTETTAVTTTTVTATEMIPVPEPSHNKLTHSPAPKSSPTAAAPQAVPSLQPEPAAPNLNNTSAESSLPPHVACLAPGLIAQYQKKFLDKNSVYTKNNPYLDVRFIGDGSRFGDFIILFI